MLLLAGLLVYAEVAHAIHGLMKAAVEDAAQLRSLTMVASLKLLDYCLPASLCAGHHCLERIVDVVVRRSGDDAVGADVCGAGRRGGGG